MSALDALIVCTFWLAGAGTMIAIPWLTRKEDRFLDLFKEKNS